MFFDNWNGIVRVLIVGVLAYAALVGMLRVSGKRTLSKMNAFDLIVTIALGSTLATVLLTKDVALVEGLTAFALLISLQWIVAWLGVHSRRWRSLIKSEPQLLVLRGEMLRDAMRRERITEDEICAAARSKGFDSLQQLEAVVLETDGSVSVVESSGGDAPPAALRTLRGFRGTESAPS